MASVFRRAQKPEKAMIAHEKALDWQELFELAVQQELSVEGLKDIAYRIAGVWPLHLRSCLVSWTDSGCTEDLTAKKRTSEAALVLLDYATDVREAVIALVEGSHFSEARRVVSLLCTLFVASGSQHDR